LSTRSPPSGGRVGQSDRVLSDGIKLHQAKRIDPIALRNE
jgi:hypothetical protein